MYLQGYFFTDLFLNTGFRMVKLDKMATLF